MPMDLGILMSQPIMVAVAAVVVILLGVVVVSIIRGMLNMMLAALLVVTALLTAEMFFAFYLSTEGSLRSSFNTLIKDEDAERIVDVAIVAIDEDSKDIDLSPAVRKSLVSGIASSDPKKVDLAVGAILFDRMQSELASKGVLGKLGVSKLELTPEAKLRISEAMMAQNDTDALKLVLMREVTEAAIKEKGITEEGERLAMADNVEAVYGNALGSALVSSLASAGKALGAKTVLPMTEPQVRKFRELAASVKGSADFSKRYQTMNVGLRTYITDPKRLFVERGPEAIFVVALPLLASPLAVGPALVSESITPAELHGSLQTGLLVCAALDLVLVGALFLVNGVLSLSISGGFKDAFKYFGIAFMVAGALLFAFMKVSVGAAGLLAEDGPVMSSLQGKDLQSRIALGVAKIYAGNLVDQVESGLDVRKYGGIGLVVIGLVSYANSILGFIPFLRVKKKEAPAPKKEKKEAPPKEPEPEAEPAEEPA